MLDGTKKVIQNVGETVLGALAGEFNNDPSVTQIIIDGIISLIPILDQIADGRDIAAHIYFMTTKGEYNKIERWIGLAFSLIGCIPELGTVIKSASKLLFKGTAKVLPHLKELLQLIGKIIPNGTVNSFSSFLSQNWQKYVQQGITKWEEILNQLYVAVNFIPGILLQKKNQVLNKLKEIQGLSGRMLKSAFDKIKAKISKVLDDLASKINPQKKAATNVDNATKKASQLPMALTTAKAITEANDANNTPIPILIALLNAGVKSKYIWIKRFEASPKKLGHYSIHMIASDHEIKSDYTTKGKTAEKTAKEVQVTIKGTENDKRY